MIIAGKKEHLTDYMENVRSLLSRYMPPERGPMQAAFEAGKVALEAPAGAVTLMRVFSSLPDSRNFMQESVLAASARQIQINMTNFGYQRLGSR
jgi:hypothetical protein